MAEPKTINLSKFFSGETNSISSIASGAEQRTMTAPVESVNVPASKLTEILGIIKDQTELTEIQEQKIVTENRNVNEFIQITKNQTEIIERQQDRIEQESRDDKLLQGMLDGLQQRFSFLQNAFLSLTNKFESELQERKREINKKESLILSQYAESSKLKEIDYIRKTEDIDREDSTFGMSRDVIDEKTGKDSERSIANAAMLSALGLAGAAGLMEETLGGRSSGGGSATASAGVWRPVLDLIASGEGSWESMYPGTTLPGATKMTISEVYKQSTGAVGRYQFTTLIQQAKAAGLNPDRDLFSPENQDKIAVNIIEEKLDGKSWLTGNYPGGDEAFADRLSFEWAALKGKGGVGKYDNDGKNKATIDFNATVKALKEVKGGYSEKSTDAMGPQSRVSTPPASVNLASGSVQSYVPPEPAQQNIQPIVLPVGGGSPKTATKTQISSGSAVPPGVSRNFNNPYPDIIQAHFNIIV